jgi:hypothetical protein
MRQIEEIDPELIDHAVRRVCAASRPLDRELAIATHLGGSAELLEWVEMIYRDPAPDPDPRIAAMSKLFSAVAVGLEVGYALGFHEAERGRPRMK